MDVAEQITLHTLWGLRRGFEDGTPELMVAWDEYCVDNYAEGYENEKQEAIDSWKDDLVAHRELRISVPIDQVESAFRVNTIEGSIRDA